MLLQPAPGSTSACCPSHQHRGDSGGGCHSVHRASTGAKLGGLTPRQPQFPLAGAQRALTHTPLHLKPSLPKLRDKGQRELLSSPGGGERCAWAGPRPWDGRRRGPRTGGDGSAGHFPAPPAAASRRNTVCSAVLESHFSRPEGEPGYRFSKPARRNPLARASCPRCRGLPRPLHCPRAASLLRMPNLQDFQAWLKYFSVIWCRGRSRLKLTQIYSSLPG